MTVMHITYELNGEEHTEFATKPSKQREIIDRVESAGGRITFVSKEYA